ncbi:MAG: hypothetical protein EPO58_16165 [Chitinophagaceae bacterium]|nr:MAG: hypothetical protein EPO58_16165 [Chitinophagaceae bacterium]
MLSSVSWQSYIVGIGIVTILYYAVIGKIFYSRELMQLISRSKEQKITTEREFIPSSIDPAEQVNRIIGQIGSIIKIAADQNTPQPELFFSLQQLIRSYPLIQESEYRGAVRQYIKEVVEGYGSYDLSEEELTQLWKP